ncbi:hypothetical protein LG314_09935 [Agrococcus terreus]|uniref:hypothetical protein n=1 Tax=Agrococcus terreus TaxID=574649 RepID=UPI00384D6BFA
MPIPPLLALVLREAPGLVQQYGPSAVEWLRQHPDLVRDLVAQVRPHGRRDAEPHVAGEAPGEADPDGTARADVDEVIAMLREQIAYLVESADDAVELDRAEAWTIRLRRLERARGLVGTAAERRRLEGQVERLRAEVVAAFLIERIEDEGGPSPRDR